MTLRYITFAVLTVLVVFSVLLIMQPVNGQQAGPTNPNANVTTAYKLMQNSTKFTTPPIIVTTDLKSYQQGDSIIVRGAIRELENQTAITVRVISSLKNLVSIAQMVPSADGGFSKIFIATGPLWKDAGNYTIIANYGSYTQANSTFYYAGGNGLSTITPAISDTYHLKSGEQTYDIPYTIKGGTVTSMDILADKFTLEITIVAKTDGSISATLPRELIDAKVLANLTADEKLTGKTINPKDLADDKFLVTVGGKDVSSQFTETKTSSSRTLSIPFHSGDTKIDIIGTIIVPEFGPIAALVLAIAIISIIAVSAKTGLRFMPKY